MLRTLAHAVLVALPLVWAPMGAVDAQVNIKQVSGVGTAASKDVGTGAGQIPVLDGSARLPAVDGSLLLNLPSGSMGGTAGTTANAIVRASGTGGSTLRGSLVVLSDTGTLSGVENITLSGTVDGVDVSSIPSYAQSSDPELAALAALTSAADKGVYFTGSGGAGVFNLTAGGRALGGVAWSAGTQIFGLTAAATSTAISVGSAANNIPQIDANGNYPTTPFDCSWTKTWSASDGSITSAGGFTLTNLSEGAAAQDSAGATYIPLTSTSAAGRVTYGSNLPTDASSWEVELDFIPATLDGSSGIQVDPGNGGTAERLFHATSWKNQAGTAWAVQPVTNAVYRQVWTLVRHASSFTYAYLNHTVPLGAFPFSSGSAGASQRWCFGNCGATSVTRTYKIYRISIKAGGVCAYPPPMRPIGVITGQ